MRRKNGCPQQFVLSTDTVVIHYKREDENQQFRQNLASEEERKLMVAIYGVIGQWLLVLSLLED